MVNRVGLLLDERIIPPPGNRIWFVLPATGTINDFLAQVVSQLDLPRAPLCAYLHDFKLLPSSDISVLRDNELVQIVPQSDLEQLQGPPSTSPHGNHRLTIQPVDPPLRIAEPPKATAVTAGTAVTAVTAVTVAGQGNRMPGSPTTPLMEGMPERPEEKKRRREPVAVSGTDASPEGTALRLQKKRKKTKKRKGAAEAEEKLPSGEDELLEEGRPEAGKPEGEQVEKPACRTAEGANGADPGGPPMEVEEEEEEDADGGGRTNGPEPSATALCRSTLRSVYKRALQRAYKRGLDEDEAKAYAADCCNGYRQRKGRQTAATNVGVNPGTAGEAGPGQATLHGQPLSGALDGGAAHGTKVPSGSLLESMLLDTVRGGRGNGKKRRKAVDLSLEAGPEGDNGVLHASKSGGFKSREEPPLDGNPSILPAAASKGVCTRGFPRKGDPGWGRPTKHIRFDSPEPSEEGTDLGTPQEDTGMSSGQATEAKGVVGGKSNGASTSGEQAGARGTEQMAAGPHAAPPRGLMARGALAGLLPRSVAVIHKAKAIPRSGSSPPGRPPGMPGGLEGGVGRAAGQAPVTPGPAGKGVAQAVEDQPGMHANTALGGAGTGSFVGDQHSGEGSPGHREGPLSLAPAGHKWGFASALEEPQRESGSEPERGAALGTLEVHVTGTSGDRAVPVGNLAGPGPGSSVTVKGGSKRIDRTAEAHAPTSKAALNGSEQPPVPAECPGYRGVTSRECEELAPVEGLPEAGDVLAYRLFVNAGRDGAVSEWRLGRVLEADAEGEILWLEPWPDPDCHPMTNAPIELCGAPNEAVPLTEPLTEGNPYSANGCLTRSRSDFADIRRLDSLAISNPSRFLAQQPQAGLAAESDPKAVPASAGGRGNISPQPLPHSTGFEQRTGGTLADITTVPSGLAGPAGIPPVPTSRATSRSSSRTPVGLFRLPVNRMRATSSNPPTPAAASPSATPALQNPVAANELSGPSGGSRERNTINAGTSTRAQYRADVERSRDPHREDRMTGSADRWAKMGLVDEEEVSRSSRAHIFEGAPSLAGKKAQSGDLNATQGLLSEAGISAGAPVDTSPHTEEGWEFVTPYRAHVIGLRHDGSTGGGVPSGSGAVGGGSVGDRGRRSSSWLAEKTSESTGQQKRGGAVNVAGENSKSHAGSLEPKSVMTRGAVKPHPGVRAMALGPFLARLHAAERDEA
eukprot:jgi/Botrbrau1/13185/Bobra.242_1s0015.1